MKGGLARPHLRTGAEETEDVSSTQETEEILRGNWGLDFEMFHFQVFEFELFDFQKRVDFEKHALITSSWPSILDFENLNDNCIWKISLLKFDVGNWTWSLTFEICLSKLDFGKLDFGNFTFDLWCWTFQLDFWRLTFENSLLKIDCWNVTLKSWLLLGFAWVFGPLAEDAKTRNCNDQAKAIDLLLTKTDLI